MKLKSYLAAGVGSALKSARREVGPDSMLVDSSRTSAETRHLGEYEVVCAVFPPNTASAPVGANAEETAKLTRENQMLRNIVVRERQEEARREQAKKLMHPEFDKLKIKAKALTAQIELPAPPQTTLSPD